MTYHWERCDDGIVVYLDGEARIITTKVWQAIRLANDCNSGLLSIPTDAEPFDCVDHPWLLRLAGACSEWAADNYE